MPIIYAGGGDHRTDYGIHSYPDAQNILILCDAGGGNSYRHHVFKKQLFDLSDEIGITLIVVHYPPYTSKYNPIERRLFCHVHSAMKGIIFSNYNIIKELIEKTSTTTGLSVIVKLNLKKYEKAFLLIKIK